MKQFVYDHVFDENSCEGYSLNILTICLPTEKLPSLHAFGALVVVGHSEPAGHAVHVVALPRE